MKQDYIALIPFVELRRYWFRGKERVVIMRDDGKTETLWPDEVTARLNNQKIQRENKRRRAARNRGAIAPAETSTQP